MYQHAFDLSDVEKCVAVAYRDFFNLNKKECSIVCGTEFCKPDYEASMSLFEDKVVYECNFLICSKENTTALESLIEVFNKDFRDRKHGRVSLFSNYIYQSVCNDWNAKLCMELVSRSFSENASKLQPDMSALECLRAIPSIAEALD